MKKQIKILIVEDEYITAKILSNFLELSGYEVVGCAMDIDDALIYLEKEIIDFVILDINLNDKKDGIWLATHIKENYNIPFIYLTAYIDKGTFFRAIKTSPYGFLAKPFQKNELFSAIEIALHKHNEISNLSPETVNKKNNKTIFLKNIDRFDKVLVEDIYFIESQKNYLIIHTNDLIYKHRATLKEFIELLPNTNFVKVHRAFLVNINKIISIDKANNIIVVLDKNIPISKNLKEKVISKINLI